MERTWKHQQRFKYIFQNHYTLNSVKKLEDNVMGADQIFPVFLKMCLGRITLIIQDSAFGASLVVQWLRLCTSTTAGTGLIPGQ